MPPKQYKTTPEDFEVFCTSVRCYLNLFGLKSWEVVFDHSDKHIENRATCESEIGPRHVKFTLTKSKWPYKPSLAEIKLLGFHECCELLLAEIVHFAESRRPEGDLNNIVHNLIHTLENSLFVLIEDKSNETNNQS